MKIKQLEWILNNKFAGTVGEAFITCFSNCVLYVIKYNGFDYTLVYGGVPDSLRNAYLKINGDIDYLKQFAQAHFEQQITQYLED